MFFASTGERKSTLLPNYAKLDVDNCCQSQDKEGVLKALALVAKKK